MVQPVDEPLAFRPDDEGAWHRLARGYRLAGLLLSSHRMGLLAQLRTKPGSLDDLAHDLAVDRALLEQMLRALECAGLLERTDAQWLLSEAGQRLIGDPAATAELDSLVRDYRRWGALDEHARMPSVEEHADAETDHDDRSIADVDSARQYALRLSARHRAQAVMLVEHVEPTRPIRLMDVGGADGFIARVVCERWPEAECVVLEEPAMAEVARKACADHDRISVIEGDFLGEGGRLPSDPLPCEADVVVLSHVLQGRPKARQRELTARAAGALAPGGCVLSCESVLRSDQRGPLDTILWAVGQTALRREGHMLTTIEQDILLRASGLAASAAWWVSAATRAVMGVRTDAGVRPALRVRDGHPPLL